MSRNNKHFWSRGIIALVTVVCCCAQTTIANATIPKIIVSQLVEHPALDASWRGIQDELKSQGYIKGETIEWVYHNAQGSVNSNMLIAKHAATVQPKPILAIAISTQSAQCLLKAAGKRIPIVFSAVSDAKAAGLVKDLDHPGGMITGVTDLPPIEDQIPTYKQVLPGLKKLGVIYNSGEVNSVDQINKLIKICGNDIEVIKRSVGDTKEIQSATKSLLGKVQAIYIPLDNTVLAAAGMIIKLAQNGEQPTPVIGGSVGIIKQGALMSVGFDHYELGRQTGRVAIRILKGELPGNIPVRAMPQTQTFLNMTITNKLGVNIPNDILERAKKYN